MNVELIVAELLGAAFDADIRAPIVVAVEEFPRLHKIRLRGITNVTLHDAPFHLRERVLHGLTLGSDSDATRMVRLTFGPKYPRSA